METIDKVAQAAHWQVPEYEVTCFSPISSDYCVCVFVLNEGEKIIAQLERMKHLAPLFDIIIADGGSTDGVLQPQTLTDAGVTALLIKTGAGKLSAQMRMAFAYAMANDYKGVITIDGNNKDDPSAIPDFACTLDNGFDHVQGSRFVRGGVAENTPLSRLLGLKLVHAPLISLTAGFRYTDTTNGFRAYSRKFLLDPRVNPFREIFSTYELHYYLAIRAARLGYKVTELPVTRKYPANQPVPSKISPIRGNLGIVRALILSCLHRFNPSEKPGTINGRTNS